MMNKKILAVAVAGAIAAPGLALAQATTSGTNVQVYGLFDQAVRQDRYSNSLVVGQGNLNKWHMHNGAPNRLGFRGTEALGGGMTAFFQVESQVFMDARVEPAFGSATNATVGGRPTFMGLRAGWGEVSVGYQESVYKDVYAATWQVGPTQPHFGIIMGMGNTTGQIPGPAAGATAATCAGGQASGIGTAGITAVATATPSASTAPAAGAGTPLCGTEAVGNGTSFNRTLSDTIQFRSPVFAGFRYSTQMAIAELKENPTQPTATTGINGATGYSQYKPSYGSHSLTWSGGPFSLAAGYEVHTGFRAINTPYTNRNAKDTAISLGARWNYGKGLLAAGWERLKYGDSSGNGASGAAATTSNNFNIVNWTVQGTYDLTAADTAAIGYSKTPGAKNCGNAFSATTGVFAGPAGTAGNAACGTAGSANMITLSLDHRFSKRTALYAQYSRINNGSGSNYYYIAGPTTNTGLGVSGALSAGTDVSTYGVGMKHTF